MKKMSDLTPEQQAEAKKLFKMLAICVVIAIIALWWLML